MSFKRILVAIDGQPPLNPRVFEQALDLAQKESASLMLFHCVNGAAGAEGVTPATPEIGLDPFRSGLDPLSSGLGVGYSQPFQQGLQEEVLQEQVEQVQKWLQTYYQQALDLGIPTAFDYGVGDAGRQICELAQNWGADLVVLGRRGLKGLTEFIEGSVSNHVMHHAPCSVLVIQGVKG